MKYRTHDEQAAQARQAISSMPMDGKMEDRARRMKAKRKGKKAWKLK